MIYLQQRTHSHFHPEAHGSVPACAGASPVAVSYMAVHGTGTPLGDPIEMGALGQALACPGVQKRHSIALGSIKSCYGHTEGAAGLTGALLALQATHFQVCQSRRPSG